ncbi:RidA family protein [Halioxenophilus sp. WMMB6]|uniref:RidA family protein n=1 Tax=Halioxenophilus sp. WMMB6 TaxID=3073815 RepID=UPI00295E60C9|nr:RidA family protein [Halioxenophilus sp. WMMB6]
MTNFKTVNPTTIRAPFGNYVHGIEAPAGSRLFFTSGQLGTGKDDATPESITEQATICFTNIQEILKANALTMADVVKVTAYVTSRDYFPAYMAVRDQFLPQPVASTLLIVGGFTRPEFKVEVEVIAVTSEI